MKREFLYTEEILGYDNTHTPTKDGLFCITKPDPLGQDEHRAGCDHFKKLIKDGVKLMPILVQRKIDGTLKKLDGFKRWHAHKELEIPIMECFVCEPEDEGTTFNYDGSELICCVGGQTYQRFPNPVEYGEAIDQTNGSGEIIMLYRTEGFRIEYREAIHLHWGFEGRCRLILGRRDFDLLAKAFINSDF